MIPTDQEEFGTLTLLMQKALGKKAADCKVVKWEGLVDGRKAKLSAQGQNIPLPVSRDCLRLYPLYHNS